MCIKRNAILKKLYKFLHNTNHNNDSQKIQNNSIQYDQAKIIAHLNTQNNK